MKVCTCCYDPTIQDQNPFSAIFGAMIDSAIIVPDDAPKLRDGLGYSIPLISHEVLEKAGLKWKHGEWCKPDGSRIEGIYDLATESGKHVEPWEREVLAGNTTVIPFLKSRPKDSSTLGEGDHIKRQAKVLLQLFDQHVLGGSDATQNHRYYGEGHFTDDYTLVQFKQGMLREGSTDEDEDIDEMMGFDFKNLKKLREEVAADQKKLEELGVDPCGDSETAKQYWYKLRRAIGHNVQTLRMATGMTSDFYGLAGNPLVNPMNVLLGTFTARHNTDCARMGVQALYDAMLPILVSKLKAAGYSDTKENVEWDYDEPSKARGLRLAADLASQLGGSFSLGIATKPTLSCKQCGHEVEVEIYQELDVDGKTPKGDPQVRGLPDVCPKCGNTIKQTE